MNSPVTEWVFLTWNKKRKDNLETRSAFIEISILKFTKRLKTPWNTFEKYGFLWRESAIFRLFSCASGWNERWYASIYKEMELEMDCLTSRCFCRKLRAITISSVPKYMYLQGWSLKFKRWLGKIQRKSTRCVRFQPCVETGCNFNLKFTGLKDLFIKRVQKISQRWIMCIANIAILELRIFSGRYHFRFTSTGENFYCWRWLVLPKVSQGKWFQDLQRPCM